jgi:hypothetical protein
MAWTRRKRNLSEAEGLQVQDFGILYSPFYLKQFKLHNVAYFQISVISIMG